MLSQSLSLTHFLDCAACDFLGLFKTSGQQIRYRGLCIHGFISYYGHSILKVTFEDVIM